MAGTVTVEWTHSETTTYRRTFDAADWAEIEETADDDLSEFEEAENEISYENDRVINETTREN